MAEETSRRRPRRRPRRGSAQDEGALPSHYRVRALEQALSVLGALEAESGLTLPEIGRRVGVPVPVAHKLVLHLERAGLVGASPASGRYHLGAARLSALSRSALASLNPWDEVRGLVAALREATGMAGLVAVLAGSRCVYVEQFRGPERALGRAFPAHATALGKVLLAHLPQRERPGLLAETTLTAWGPGTITEPKALEAELRATRERGWALEDEELDRGRRSIGAPVRDVSGAVVAAVGIGGRAGDLPDARLPDLSAEVVRQAGRLSAALGAGDPLRAPGERLSVEVLGVVEPPLLPPGEGARSQTEEEGSGSETARMRR